MNRCKRLIAVALVLVLLVAPLVCLGAGLYSVWRSKCLEAPYASPGSTLRDADLVGTWEAQYGGGVDRLVIRAHGTFKQRYEDRWVKGYLFETPWNEWTVTRFADGRARLRLGGARYYLAGIRVAEEGGRFGGDMPHYDPVGGEFLEMDDALVLNVRVDSSGELLLLHMWDTGDAGFPILFCGWTMFRRVQTR